jgi:hypothetical protein
MSDLKRMNLGGMLTEFGAVNDSATAVEMIDYLTGIMLTAVSSVGLPSSLPSPYFQPVAYH